MDFGFDVCISAAPVANLRVFGDPTVKGRTNTRDACSPVPAIAGWVQCILDFLRTERLVDVSIVTIADSKITARFFVPRKSEEQRIGDWS